MATCGDFGGLNAQGKPCGRPRRSAPCPEHDSAAPDTVQRRKRDANQAAFLVAVGEVGNITRAAEMAGIDRKLHYVWLEAEDGAAYREAFDAAMDAAADRLEEEARRRAVEGVEEPVGWYQGEPGGYIRRYSDTLLIFLLKGARPHKFRERFEQVSAESVDEAAQRVRDMLAQMEEADGIGGAS